MLRNSTSLLVLLCWPTFASAQAFGVVEGAPVSRYGGTPTGGRDQFEIKVPQPNSEFDSYVAYATPETGICAVAGLGRTHESDNYGYAVRSAFERLRLALRGRYGPSKDFDFLHSGSIWKDANEFGWSLYKKERSLSSYWDREEGSINLGSVDSIVLRAYGLESDKTYVSLRYEFTNHATCFQAGESKDNAGL